VGGWFRSFLQGNRFLSESHPRQWVDGSDPFYTSETGFSLNPTHGSGWMIQILSTRETGFSRNPTHGSGWMVQILSTRKQVSVGIPPTAVGGWFRSFLQGNRFLNPTHGSGWMVQILSKRKHQVSLQISSTPSDINGDCRLQ